MTKTLQSPHHHNLEDLLMAYMHFVVIAIHGTYLLKEDFLEKKIYSVRDSLVIHLKEEKLAVSDQIDLDKINK